MLDLNLPSWPSFTEEEADVVTQVLLSNKVNYWTGSECKKFEQEFAEWCDSKFAIALSNGTVALEIALQGLGVGTGDEVIVTPRTFIASVSSIIKVGAIPVFADVDLQSQNINASSIVPVLSERTKAIICVHLGGWPCDMEPIMELACENNLYVIEDCAQAHGAEYKGKPVGSIGHVGAWSFCQDKIMTTGGEGGMVTTNDEDLWSRMWSLKDHGKDYNSIKRNKESHTFSWVHDSIGGNGRMTEMQAAIGRIQLRRMPEWNSKRKANADDYTSIFSDCRALRLADISGMEKHAWYKYTAFLRPGYLAAGWSRDRIVNELSQVGVPCRIGPCPEVYLEKAFDKTEYKPRHRLPNARELGETSLVFLVHPTLEKQHVCDMAHYVSELIVKATKT